MTGSDLNYLPGVNRVKGFCFYIHCGIRHRAWVLRGWLASNLKLPIPALYILKLCNNIGMFAIYIIFT